MQVSGPWTGDSSDLVNQIEAVLFAAGAPMTFRELRRVFERLWAADDAEVRQQRLANMRPALVDLEQRWSAAGQSRGFFLARVAEGWTFRSNPRYAEALRAMRDGRPQRLSKAALETLAIVAYRQPVTKPEVDHIRGVDCAGTLKFLLDRGQVRIVGKKEEAGRPLLYGTTREFLSLFNLANLNELPSLRDVHELTEASRDELRELDGLPSLTELSDSAKQLRLEEEPTVEALEQAVSSLDATEVTTRAALRDEGVLLDDAAAAAAAETGAVHGEQDRPKRPG